MGRGAAQLSLKAKSRAYESLKSDGTLKSGKGSSVLLLNEMPNYSPQILT